MKYGEKLFRALFDQAPLGIGIVDAATGNWLEINQRYADIVGRDRESLRHSNWMQLTDPADLAANLETKRQLDAGEIQFAQFRKRYRRPDGSIVWTNVTLSSVNLENPDRLAVLSIIEDISERKRAEEKLSQALERAEAASRAKTEFVANMSHEIRTPLNVILGLTQVLELEGDVADDERRDIAHRIHAAGDVLLRSLNDVLDLARIETGQLGIEHKPFQVNQILGDLEDLTGTLAHAKGLTLCIDTGECGEWRLQGDAVRLEQILLNLVSNAIKFSTSGSIVLSARPRPGTGAGVRLLFEVRDHGIGVPAEKIPTLFKPFSQADSGIARRFGGSGLGLSICKRLVELMGGTIGVESTEGAGSTFWFELPFELADGGSIAREAARVHPEAPVPGNIEGLRLLVVDDSDMNVDLFARVLGREGAEVIAATNGREAVEILRDRPGTVDAVVMDLQMPVLDGVTATRIIRKELHLVDLPVIACSAGAYADDRATAIEAGATDFIVKPIAVSQLVRMLAQYIHRPSSARTVSAERRPAASIGKRSVERFPDIAGIDRDQAIALLDGDRALFLELLQRFVAQYRDATVRIRTALQGNDRAAAMRLLHTLRGTAGYLSASKLAMASRQLEDAIKLEDPDEERLLTSFSAELHSLVQAATPCFAPAPHETANPPLRSAGALDRVELSRLSMELVELLAHNMLKARRVAEEIETLVAGSALAEPFRPVGESVRRLDFRGAETALVAFTIRSSETSKD